ncbi:sensor histidine kinase [Salipaludibacillus sp. CF4.18]|uniref:sensor histidine kinase n=1 Tax=Salipaludibacillus sp. CF4.18 TaxID=3373081 RepID=UPI003EE606E8
MKFFHSLFFKLLFCLLVISIIPLSIVGYITYENASNSMTENLNYHADYILKQRVASLHQLQDNLERLSNGIVTNRVFAEFSENTDYKRNMQLYIELDKLLVSIENILPSFKGITIINEEHFMYYYGYSIGLNVQGKDIIQSDWYTHIENQPFPKISSLHDRNYSNQVDASPVYSFIYEGWDKKLRNRSVIIIDFTEKFISKILNVSEGTVDITGSLIYSNNEIVYSTGNELQLTYQDISSNPSGTIISAPNGQNYIIYKQGVPSFGWTIVEYFNVDNLYQPVYDIRNFFIFTIIISVLICTGASLFVTKQISSPIYKLQRKMRKVEKGNFEEEYITNSKDVIGDLASGFNHMLVQIKGLIKSVENEEKLKREAEVTALQLQINPHFIYNTLETINSLARKKKDYEISHLIVLLGRLLRLSINTFNEKIPVSKEINYIQYYLEIQQKRMRSTLVFEIDVDPVLDNQKIIKWILQPIIENAIIHGIDPLKGDGRIDITGITKDSEIIFSVKDNGVGMSFEQVNQIRDHLNTNPSELAKYKNKIGLYNVQARIHLHYGASYGIKVFSEPHVGTEFQIIIPRKEQDL